MSSAKFQPFSKSFGMGACILVLVFIGSLFIIASGGGGGDGDSSAPAESATLSDTNADAAADAAIQTLSMAGPMDLLDSGMPLSTTGGAAQVDSPLRGIFNRALDGYQTVVAGAKGMRTPMEVSSCTNGGTMDIPELTQADLMEAAISGSLSISMSYDDCVEGSETMDGSMTMRITGDIINGIVNTMTITTSLFRYADTLSVEDITLTGYQMIGDQLTFDSISGELTAATFTLTGDVEGTAEGQTINARFHKMALRFVEEIGGESLSINGLLYNDCIGGWATVATAADIFMPTAAECPTAGDFSIKSGDNTVRAEAASNSSVTISLNGTPLTTYTTCNDVEGTCVSP